MQRDADQRRTNIQESPSFCSRAENLAGMTFLVIAFATEKDIGK
jgi:hypothetical protein